MAFARLATGRLAGIRGIELPVCCAGDSHETSMGVRGLNAAESCDPAYKKLIEARAKGAVPPVKDNPLVIGYYYGFKSLQSLAGLDQSPYVAWTKRSRPGFNAITNVYPSLRRREAI